MAQMPAGFVPDGFEPDAAPPPSMKPGRDDAGGYLMEMLSNIPESAGNLLKNTLEGVGGMLGANRDALNMQAMKQRTPDQVMGEAMGIVPGIIDYYADRYGSPEARERTVRDDPVGMVSDMLPVGGALSKAPAAGRATMRGARTAAANAAGFAAKHPTTVSTIGGAVPGVLSGNPMAALIGAGVGFERAPSLGRRFAKIEKQLRPSPKPSAPMARQAVATSAAPAAAGATATNREAFLRELIAREPDWRTVDAVPVDAITRDVTRGGRILEAGESRIGIGERLAEILKDPTPANLAEADRLARAARQRMHISRKSSGAGRRPSK